jgi:acyl carrier protein
MSLETLSREQIFRHLVDILDSAFEIAPERVVPEARLSDDLDIDSIDAVDLIVRLKPLVGRAIKPEAFKSVRTVQDVVDALANLAQAE